MRKKQRIELGRTNVCSRSRRATDELLSSSGDLVKIESRWYVSHTALLRLARRKHCIGIHVEAVDSLCEPTASRFVFKAIVYPTKGSSGFAGYGDADPSNVSPLVRGAEMRVAETRAVNRALRKAYGIGLCSVEELGTRGRAEDPIVEVGKRPTQSTRKNQSDNGNANGSGGPRVRDRLCQLIRRHGLDPESVKAYAIEFCGTASLKDAARARVEEFVDHLAEQAERDRDALLCQLNSYPRTEVKAEEPKAGAA